jgi:hypothetical protein
LSESAGVTYAWDSIADKITAFMIYCVLVTVFAAVMIYKVSPIYGKRNPMVYLSICSTVGSISIMAIKGFGIALKLTFAGNNQFSHPSTYVFAIVVVVCILTQMNYFNKALSQFSTNMLVPVCQTSPNRALLIVSQCQPSLLCHLYNIHPHRLFHPLPGLQHSRCEQHHLPSLRIPHHFRRRLSTQSFSRGPKRRETRNQQW